MPKKPTKQYRMHPEFGGDPLPWSPLILPYEGEPVMRERALAYCKVLQAELDVEEPKWSGGQRQEIRRKLAKWRIRALGEDAHFNKHGTFRRPMNADPPGFSELWQEQAKRAAMDDGTYVSNQAHKARIIRPGDMMRKVIRRLRKQYGTKTIDPPKD